MPAMKHETVFIFKNLICNHYNLMAKMLYGLSNEHGKGLNPDNSFIKQILLSPSFVHRETEARFNNITKTQVCKW